MEAQLAERLDLLDQILQHRPHFRAANLLAVLQHRIVQVFKELLVVLPVGGWDRGQLHQEFPVGLPLEEPAPLGRVLWCSGDPTSRSLGSLVIHCCMRGIAFGTPLGGSGYANTLEARAF